MNELKELTKDLRECAERAEAFSILLDKFSVYDTEYRQIKAWFYHSEISAEEMQKILDEDHQSCYNESVKRGE